MKRPEIEHVQRLMDLISFKIHCKPTKSFGPMLIYCTSHPGYKPINRKYFCTPWP